jgi:putative FmdB family regulatory protein
LPRYRYRCEGCEQEFVAFHSLSDTQDSCTLCGHESVTKMVGKPIVLNKKLTNSEDTGSLTNEYIEANRELLKDMKEEASNGFYEQT